MSDQNKLKASLLIPTYNAGQLWEEVLKSINEQDFAFHSKIIVDSGSKDDTVKLAKQYGFRVIEIPSSEFNHGTTRQLLVNNANGADICVFITQDAILADRNSITNLVMSFNNPFIGLAYGRQLPHKNAAPLEVHARQFNYPPQASVRGYEDKDRLGFKVFFCSNSFSAYRVEALNEAGGFPSDSIMGEDALVSARMLLNHYKIAYVAEAAVYHSHSYTFGQEFRRYFDTRVFHEQNKWLIENYGKPTGEGIKYVRSELNFVAKKYPASIFKVIYSVFAKWLGYSSGRYYQSMPKSILKRLSMHSAYWS